MLTPYDTNRQLGIVEFGPLRQYFLELYDGTHAVVPSLPGIPATPLLLDRGWDPEDPSKPPTAPALVRAGHENSDVSGGLARDFGSHASRLCCGSVRAFSFRPVGRVPQLFTAAVGVVFRWWRAAWLLLSPRWLYCPSAPVTATRVRVVDPGACWRLCERPRSVTALAMWLMLGVLHCRMVTHSGWSLPGCWCRLQAPAANADCAGMSDC